MTKNTRERGPSPRDTFSSYQVLDRVTGSRPATMDLLADRSWPGATLAGADLFGRQPLRLAQASGVLSDALPTFPGMALPKGAIFLEGAIVTAAIVLAGIKSLRERQEVDRVIADYKLDPAQAADMLAARAYVWTIFFGPWSHWDLLHDYPATKRAAELVMRYEQVHPGTTGLAVSGRSREAMSVIDALIDEAIIGPAYPEPVERRSQVAHPALSTTSAKARSLVGLQPGGQWVAHHLIPFNVVFGLPEDVQKAIAASGWRMDSEENLIALPGNLAAFINQPGPIIRPLQSGPHPLYDYDVRTLVQPVTSLTQPDALRDGLHGVEDEMRRRIIAIRYNPRLV